MNLSGIYSRLYPYRKYIKPGMLVHYCDICNNSNWTVTACDDKIITLREEGETYEETRNYENMQRGWELDWNEIKTLEAIHPELKGIVNP